VDEPIKEVWGTPHATPPRVLLLSHGCQLGSTFISIVVVSATNMYRLVYQLFSSQSRKVMSRTGSGDFTMVISERKKKGRELLIAVSVPCTKRLMGWKPRPMSKTRHAGRTT
jgi:hypothetical protein